MLNFSIESENMSPSLEFGMLNFSIESDNMSPSLEFGMLNFSIESEIQVKLARAGGY
jgi:hypothetical protein